MNRRIEITLVVGGRKFPVRRGRQATVERIVEDGLTCLAAATGLVDRRDALGWDIRNADGKELNWCHTLSEADVSPGDVLYLSPAPGVGA